MARTYTVAIPPQTLIAYKRDKDRNPVGVVVATKCPYNGKIHYGYALCRKGDRFTKARALEIALGRTKFNEFDKICMIHSLRDTLNKVEARAKKYYKQITFAE